MIAHPEQGEHPKFGFSWITMARRLRSLDRRCKGVTSCEGSGAVLGIPHRVERFHMARIVFIVESEETFCLDGQPLRSMLT